MFDDYLLNYKPDHQEENTQQEDAQACMEIEAHTETVDPHPVISGLISLVLLAYVAASVLLAVKLSTVMGYLAILFGGSGMLFGLLPIIIIVFSAIGIARCTWSAYSKTDGSLGQKLGFALCAFILLNVVPAKLLF